MTGPASPRVTVRDDAGRAVGVIDVHPDGTLGVRVIDEAGRARVEAVAGHLAAPRPARARAACAPSGSAAVPPPDAPGVVRPGGSR